MNLEPPISLIERALSYQKSGCLDKAGLIYRGLFRRNYQSARFYTNYGVLQYQNGDKTFGLRLFERALLCDPSYQIAWDNLQVDADLMKSQATLLHISSKILGIFPDSQQARTAHVKGLIANSNYELAKISAAEGLESNPDDLMLRELSVRCDMALGDIGSALVHLLYILSVKPADVFASIGMSDIALKSGDSESAISILEAAYQDNAENYYLMLELARVYQSSGFLSKSIDMFALALAKSENSPIIASNMAYCYGEMGEIKKSFELYNRMIQQGVESPEALIPLIFICSTLGEGYLDKLREYSLLFWRMHSQNAAECGFKVAEDTSFVEKNPVPFSPGPLAKVRLGILTGDLGTHVVSSFLASFLLNYSKESLDVEIVSNQWKNDQIADVLAQTASKCFSIADYNVSSARNLLHGRKYDVIIETSGFTSGSAIHLLADRCAPIQCHWIGYHASTFMPTMDYFLGDSIMTPQAHAHHFTEQVVRLNRAWLAATPFTLIPEATGRQRDAEVVIGSFSQIAKLTDHTLKLWSDLLMAAPHAKLLLKDRFTNDIKMRERVLGIFKRQGVQSERIIFMNRSKDWFEHMNVYNMIDMALDTTPWSSATTAFDALSMGVPLVGYSGMTTSGLMSSSVLHHCDKAEWIARSDRDYVEKCMSIIENIQSFRARKRAFQSEVLKSQLFDGQSMADEIERFVCRL